MNKVILIGRLTKDPELKGEGDKRVARFTVAVDRPTKEKLADFIPCVAFRDTARLVHEYFWKGSKIAVEGSIRTGSYTKQDGTKVYTTEVYADRIEFVESKKSDSAPAPAQAQEDFMHIPDDFSEDDLPFA